MDLAGVVAVGTAGFIGFVKVGTVIRTADIFLAGFLFGSGNYLSI